MVIHRFSDFICYIFKCIFQFYVQSGIKKYFLYYLLWFINWRYSSRYCDIPASSAPRLVIWLDILSRAWPTIFRQYWSTEYDSSLLNIRDISYRILVNRKENISKFRVESNNIPSILLRCS